MDIKLHPRERHMLTYLKSRNVCVSGTALAEQLGTTTRTIRNYVTHINQELERNGVYIKSIHGKGYLLVCCDSLAEAKLQQMIIPTTNFQTREDRTFNLLARIVSSDNYLNLPDLEEEMFVSRSTLEHDIKYIISQYERKNPYLKMTIKSDKLYVENDEWKKRIALNKAFSSKLNIAFGMEIIYSDFFTQGHLENIIYSVHKAFTDFHHYMETRSSLEVALAIAIAEKRIDSGHELMTPPPLFVEPAFIETTNSIFSYLDPDISNKFGEMERYHIAFALKIRKPPGRRVIRNSNPSSFFPVDMLKLVDSVINDINHYYNIDMSKNDEFKDELCCNIYVMVHRLLYVCERPSEITSALVNLYPYTIDMSCLISKYVEETYHVFPDESELSNIAACLKRHILDKKIQQIYSAGIPVAFISHLGRWPSLFIMDYLVKNLGSMLNIRGPFSIFDKEEIELSKPVFALTTMAKEFEDIKSIHISDAMDHSVFSKIIKFIDLAKFDCVFPIDEQSLSAFRPELFFADMTFDSINSVFKFLENVLLEKGYIDSNYIASMQNREKLSPSAFANQIAIPHAMPSVALNDGIAVVILKKPLQYHSRSVSCVIMPAFVEEHTSYFNTLWRGILANPAEATSNHILFESKSLNDFLKSFLH